MKEQTRAEPRFSLCGLNCGLCPMYHISETEHCTGCGGAGRPSCTVQRCAREHGGVEYCFQCAEYPCARYTRAEPYDSFVPHRNVQRDFARAARDGLDAYRAMLEEKEALLRFLLREYNDGRRKSLFCTAVNLLELADVRETVSLLRRQTPPDAALREKGALAARLLQEAAAANGICLKLNRKKK